MNLSRSCTFYGLNPFASSLGDSVSWITFRFGFGNAKYWLYAVHLGAAKRRSSVLFVA
jgi:hypothetical protein